MQDKTLELRIPHQLSKDEARRRVASAASRLKSEHAARLASVQDHWEKDRLLLSASALGQTITGDVEVEDKLVRVRIVLPWLLAKFAEKLRPLIEKQTRDTLKLPEAK